MCTYYICMKKKIFSACLIALLTAMPASAQTINISGTAKGFIAEGLKAFVMAADRMWERPDSVALTGGRVEAATAASAINIYKLIVVNGQRQLIMPFCLNAKDGKARLNLSFRSDGGVDISNANADTKALVAFNSIYTERAKALWMKGKDMADSDLRTLATGFGSVADSLVAECKPSAVTAQYLRTWAATLTFETLEGLNYATGRDAASLGIDMKTETEQLFATADNDLSSAFDSAPRLALAVIPGGSLAEKIKALDSRVKTTSLKTRAQDMLLSRHILSFNYGDNYEEGLQELTSLTEQFSLDRKYLNEFKVRKSSIAGTPFPDGITLHDLQGNVVDFSTFRGKYVYIDMWASWCVPCIKEIPHLKALEQELHNDSVCFLSLSIDTNEEAWKKKVAALGLEGNLLINKDNLLCESLNVSGVPFFIIYDKEGRLYKYNAYRPSDPRLKPLLEGLK